MAQEGLRDEKASGDPEDTWKTWKKVRDDGEVFTYVRARGVCHLLVIREPSNNVEHGGARFLKIAFKLGDDNVDLPEDQRSKFDSLVKLCWTIFVVRDIPGQPERYSVATWELELLPLPNQGIYLGKEVPLGVFTQDELEREITRWGEWAEQDLIQHSEIDQQIKRLIKERGRFSF